MTNISRWAQFVFIGTGGLRGGWRFLAFLVSVLLLQACAYKLAGLFIPDQYLNAFTAPASAVSGVIDIMVVLVVSYTLARLERRGFDWFGFPLRLAFGVDFWRGSIVGAAMVSLLLLFALIGTGATIQGLAIHGPAFLGWLFLWIVAMVLLGISEELLFRGYPLAALTSGLGFWPAAIVLSLIFGGVHYFGKPMETVADGLNVTALGLFVCFTIQRTGALWFAIGFHAAFDFFALGFFASPNTGNNGLPLDNHLLDVTYAGPTWLTGGPQGLEASWLTLPLLIAFFVLIHKLYPRAQFSSQHTSR